jgi:GNAT superfamily N-acetyltransferase
VGTGSPPLTVRRARSGDAPILARLWFDARAEEAGARDPEHSPDDLTPFHELAARRCGEETSILLVAQSGDRAVGFYCGRIRGAVGEGLELYVVPDARRQGVAMALVKSALDCYARRGAVRISGALRGGAGSRAFWATVWEKEPSRLLVAREAAGVEWRLRSIGPDEEAGHPRLQGQPAGQLKP